MANSSENAGEEFSGKLRKKRILCKSGFADTLEGRQAAVFVHLCTTHTYYPLRDQYLRNYGQAKQSTCKISVQYPSVANVNLIANHDNESLQDHIKPSWCWRSFPKIWPMVLWYRTFTSIYMLYVIIKHTCPALLEEPIRLVRPRMPPNCYLLGRSLPNIEVRGVIAILLSFCNLTWRCTQLFKPCKNYMIGTLYFLLLDDRDISNYYKLLDGQWSRYVGETEPELVEMLHDIMSLQMDQHSNGKSRKNRQLRPNRTAQANLQLRRYLNSMTLLGFGIVVSWALTMVICFVCLGGFDTHRYLLDYPGCSPELQELHDRQQLDNVGWLMHLRGHQTVAFAGDIFENFIIWLESGLTLFSIPLTLLLNYDLTLYWRYLNAKLERILEGLRDHDHQWKPQADEATSLAIYELQMGLQDFIRQIRRADAFIGDSITAFLLVWFSLFGVMIYGSMISQDGALHLFVQGILLVSMTTVTILCIGLLTLHRDCMRSYTKFCSLMAFDRSNHCLRTIQSRDFFTRRRTCYTLFRRLPIRGSTYLTIVGWSISYFFILGSLYRH